MSLKFKPSQNEFIKAFATNKYSEILYAGTAGTGKSYGVAAFLCMLTDEYRDTRIGVFRKNLTTARKTIFHTYIKALKDLEIPFTASRGSEPRIDIQRASSSIEFFDLDKSTDPDWNKAKGLELTIAHIEEANEVDIGGKNILITRIGRWNKSGQPALIVMTCNPSPGWVKEDYRDAALDGSILPHRCFVESTKEELPQAQLDLLMTLPDIERARFLDNNWNYSDDPNQLIKYEWIKNNLIEPSEVADRLGVDVARTGEDKSILAYAKENRLVKLEELSTNNTITVGDIVLIRSQEKNIGYDNIRIDAVGVGGGTVDYLHLKKHFVYAYMSGFAPEKTDGFMQFKNKRAQDYWHLREGLRNNEIKLIDDKDLIRELTNIRYTVKDKIIQIENKQEIKKRLGYSPDRADATVMALAEIDNNTLPFVI
jgi:hypothetical protein